MEHVKESHGGTIAAAVGFEEQAPAVPDRPSLSTVVPGSAFGRRGRRSLSELAADQGVKPLATIEDWRADFWPEDGSVDDFIAAVREWRRNG